MKQFAIRNVVDGNCCVAVIATNNGKNALNKFVERNHMSAWMYEVKKIKGIWTMTDSYGSEFVAREIRRAEA